MTVVHNKALARLLDRQYSIAQLNEIHGLLIKQGTFEFSRLRNGLFPAANLQAGAEYTGYNHVWVRDNVYVAFAHHVHGQDMVARESCNTLATYFWKYRHRFEAIIDGEADFNMPMNRPHIKFDGPTLTEIDEKWAHAENDALGYFLWLFCLLHKDNPHTLSREDMALLILFVHYLQAIRYWIDEDSGHWEEARKVEASSIGVVVRALRELETLLRQARIDDIGHNGRTITINQVGHLADAGERALADILPAESVSPVKGKGRRYDAALLFLIFPMDTVAESMGSQILADVRINLEGAYGIRRYLGDSFWAADYKDHFKPHERTSDYSDKVAVRDATLRPGEEAQWCIFDPIVSIIYGRRHHKYREAGDLELQTHYFNRALGQLTDETSTFGGFKCPELYYLERGRYVPNDTVPLLWTQANLWMAFRYMQESLAIAS